MISCIICSRESDISTKLKENIATTIRCEYELVVIDNSKNNFSIFSAYNEGVRRAKGDVLCFMHEDLCYHTNNWGNLVEEKFNNDPKMGILGVLGSHHLPKCICNVGDSGLISSYYINDKKLLSNNNKYFINGLANVVVIDGMWLCIRRTLFDSRIKFDESYMGFHLYDMDICMQVINNEYKCCIVNDILIEHYSVGRIDKMFLENSRVFYEKWKNHLPIFTGWEFSESELNLSSQLAEINAYVRELEYYLDKRDNHWFFRIRKRLKKLLYV